MVSHELKTPLTSITGYAQILHRMVMKNGEGVMGGILEKMERQVKKMSVMINGFLNISRLEAGKIQMECHRFDMALLIAEIAEEFFATVSSHQLVYAVAEDLFVNADRDKIGHVMNNLISNAVKYSASGTTVNVNCLMVDGAVIFSVADQGIGINPQDLPKLFDRYYRVQGTQTVTVSGFGIGLYLSAEIIARHNGKIWAESVMGEGSTFYFSIPVAV